MSTTTWPSPVRAVGGDVVESRSSLKVPEGSILFTARSLKGSSRVWIRAEHGNVIVGLTMADGLRKLASYLGYSLNDVAAGLAL